MAFEICPLLPIFFGWLSRYAAGSPDLTMRVRIGAAHHGAAILEELDVTYLLALAKLFYLLRPEVHHAANVRQIHARQGQVVPGAEADDAADSCFGLRLKEAVGLKRPVRCVGAQCGEIVLEDKGVGVVRIDQSAGPFVAGAEIAGRVVLWQGKGWRRFRLALPGSFHAMGRDKYPLSGKQIAAAVGVLGRVERGGHTVQANRSERPGMYTGSLRCLEGPIGQGYRAKYAGASSQCRRNDVAVNPLQNYRTLNVTIEQ